MSQLKKGPSWRWKLVDGLLWFMALSMILLGFLMHTVIVPSVVTTKIYENAQLVEGTRLMNKWSNPEYKMTFNVYVYSVRNPDEIMAGATPIVKKSGPYAFDRKIENRVISHENGTVKFKKFSTYVFNETKSCQTCILGNRVWIPNIVFQKFVEAASTSGMKAAATALVSQKAFLEVEVGELLFQGYKDPFLDKICELPFMNFVCEQILDLPERIGFFFEQNNTHDGTFEINDGVADPTKLGKVLSFNGEEEVNEDWWSSDHAREIRGGDGSLFSPFLEKHKPIEIFVTQLCRTIWLDYEKEVEYNGIPAYRYILSSDVFDPEYAGNDGFCNPSDKEFYASQNGTGCLPKGLLEISQCQRGKPPVVLSMPNFLYATDEVRKSVEGLEEPVQERDTIFVDIEPRVGAILRARRCSQVNVEMWKGKDLVFPVNLSSMKSRIVPVLSVIEDVEVDEESAAMIQDELINGEWWGHALANFILFIGLLLFVAAALYTIYKLGLVKRCMGGRTESTISPLPAYKEKTATGHYKSNGYH